MRYDALRYVTCYVGDRSCIEGLSIRTFNSTVSENIGQEVIRGFRDTRICTLVSFFLCLEINGAYLEALSTFWHPVIKLKESCAPILTKPTFTVFFRFCYPAADGSPTRREDSARHLFDTLLTATRLLAALRCVLSG